MWKTLKRPKKEKRKIKRETYRKLHRQKEEMRGWR